MIPPFMLHFFAAIITMGMVLDMPIVEPYDTSPRGVLWRNCEHEAARRWVAGIDPDRADWLALGAAECVIRRGWPAEAARGAP